MDDNVTPFPGRSPASLRADHVLETSTGKLETAVVLGWDGDGRLHLTASTADRREVLWLLEKAKTEVLKQIE